MTVPDPADRLTAEDVARRLVKSVKSVRRWMSRGVLVRGRRVRLASCKVGSSRVTSGAWLEAFIDAQNPADAAPLPTPAQVARRVRDSRRRLAAIIGK